MDYQGLAKPALHKYAGSVTPSTAQHCLKPLQSPPVLSGLAHWLKQLRSTLLIRPGIRGAAWAGHSWRPQQARGIPI